MKNSRRWPRAGVLGVALPTVAAEFGATIEDVAWVTLAPGRAVSFQKQRYRIVH